MQRIFESGVAGLSVSDGDYDNNDPAVDSMKCVICYEAAASGLIHASRSITFSFTSRHCLFPGSDGGAVHAQVSVR